MDVGLYVGTAGIAWKQLSSCEYDQRNSCRTMPILGEDMNKTASFRGGRRLVLLCGAITVSLLAIAGTSIGESFKPQFVPVPLTTGLHGKWTDISAEFNRRIKLRFPIGSSDEDMAKELQREEFYRYDWTTSVTDQHVARREEDDLVCHKAAYVYWRVDDKHQLTSVEGEYREEGCL
jgi:hypothetical protein